MERDGYNATPFFMRSAVFVIAAINVCVFILTEIYAPLKIYASLNVLTIIRGKMYWQFLSYMFIHGSAMHLFGNMLGLLFFGSAVERAVGTKSFMILYFTAGLAAGAASFGIYYTAGMFRVFLLGASGAVYAVLLVFAVLYPRSLIYLWGILPVPAPVLVSLFAVIEIASQFFGFNSGVAHTTHLFGFAAAWMYVKIRMGKSPWTIWKNAYKR